jgi:phage major head subunit gpT-like protein
MKFHLKLAAVVMALVKLPGVQVRQAIEAFRADPECGAIVTSDFLAGLMTNYRAIFKQSLDEAFAEKQLYKEIATQFESTSDKESYGWLGANPSMSEWLDKRQLKGVKAYDYTLTNKHYEGTIAVNRDTYEDDKYGLIAPRIKGLANRAIRHFNQTVVSQLDDGATLLAYDGSAFFKTNRTIGDSGTIDNLKSGSYSGSSTEILTALGLAYSTMQNYKDDKGIPMGLQPDTIVCSPAMYIPILNALLPGVAQTVRPEASIFANARIFASPWIDLDADNYYVLCTKNVEVKPLIFQLRKNVEFVSMDKPDDTNVFMQNEFYYGVDDRFAVGYGDPRTCIKIIDT